MSSVKCCILLLFGRHGFRIAAHCFAALFLACHKPLFFFVLSFFENAVLERFRGFAVVWHLFSASGMLECCKLRGFFSITVTPTVVTYDVFHWLLGDILVFYYVFTRMLFQNDVNCYDFQTRQA